MMVLQFINVNKSPFEFEFIILFYNKNNHSSFWAQKRRFTLPNSLTPNSIVVGPLKKQGDTRKDMHVMIGLS